MTPVNYNLHRSVRAAFAELGKGATDRAIFDRTIQIIETEDKLGYINYSHIEADLEEVIPSYRQVLGDAEPQMPSLDDSFEKKVFMELSLRKKQ